MTHVDRKWSFFIFDGGFTQIFGQIVFIIVKTLRNTNLVATGALKWKRPHFRLTGVAQSRRHSTTGFKARLDMKMIFHSHANKTHFHLKGFVRSLVLKAWDHYFGQQIPFIENLLNFELQDFFVWQDWFRSDWGQGTWQQEGRSSGAINQQNQVSKICNWSSNNNSSHRWHDQTSAREERRKWLWAGCPERRVVNKYDIVMYNKNYSMPSHLSLEQLNCEYC